MTTSRPELVPILMYHSVHEHADRIDLPFTVTPANFRAHLRALRDWGARTITVSAYLEALESGTDLPPRTVVLTFDDGYDDTAREVLPLLQEHGFTATVYVTTGTVGRRVRASRMISWSQVRELQENGVEVGSHSHHHIALDIIGHARAADELVRSRELLEDFLQAPVPSFAYPHGYYTRRLTRLVHEAGYRSGAAARAGLNGPDTNRFALARLVVHRPVSPSHVLDLVDGRAAGVARSERTGRRAAWRIARWTGSVTSYRLPGAPAEQVPA